MLTSGPVDLGGAGGESWGRGQRFGYAPLADGRVYCFAVSNAPEGVDGGSIEQLRHLFAGWHEPIPSLLAAVDGAGLMYHDLYDLPPLPTYVRGRVVLVGDAAHAMTPNLGQGACQALEDAVELGDCLARDDLAAYDGRRRARTRMITQRSARIGRVAQLQSPVAVMLRDAALRLSPSSALPRSLAPVLDWPGK
jgi:2-polyprenyl-6-methoxyphenol hydroxylase-like FAD-dependent oxidoreductase